MAQIAQMDHLQDLRRLNFGNTHILLLEMVICDIGDIVISSYYCPLARLSPASQRKSCRPS
jgi:hypothetical protein